MDNNTLEDLRAHLFATIEALRDAKHPMDIDRAKAVSEVARTVIDSAKIEVDYIRATGQQDAALPVFGAVQRLTDKTPPKNLPTGVNNVTTHKLKG